MGFKRVKRKVSKTTLPKGGGGRRMRRLSALLAILTFILSVAGVFPARVVETWYSRYTFPLISTAAGVIADGVPFTWLDVALAGVLVAVIVSVRRRSLVWLTIPVAVIYLLFFWGWGLNYHRVPLIDKLPYKVAKTDNSGMREFTARAAGEINRLYRLKSEEPYDNRSVRDAVVARVRRVVQRIDGSDWTAASRVKVSVLATPWFHVAGIEGVFNPLGHEPIVSDSLLEVEIPFIIAHELAHVRGYPDEGDANLIAVLATLVSEDTHLQYSGWLQLWFYLRNKEADALLDVGPQRDIADIFARIQSERVRWVSNIQSAILDWYLKANRVEQGIQSYSQVAILAAGTQDAWDTFR
jgi:hypothetical protein